MPKRKGQVQPENAPERLTVSERAEHFPPGTFLDNVRPLATSFVHDPTGGGRILGATPMPPPPEGFENPEKVAAMADDDEYVCEACGREFFHPEAFEHHVCHVRTISATMPIDAQTRADLDALMPERDRAERALIEALAADVPPGTAYVFAKGQEPILSDGEAVSFRVIEGGREVRITAEDLDPDELLLRRAGEAIEAAIDCLDDLDSAEWARAIPAATVRMNLHQIRLVQAAVRLMELGGPES